MQNQALMTILVGGAAGLVASLAASMLLAPTPPAEAGSGVAAPVLAPATAGGLTREEFESELDDLRAENGMLSHRVRDLEDALARAEDRRQAVEPEKEPAAVAKDEDLLDALAALSDPNTPLPPGFTEGVREAYEDIRAEERQEREQRWAEAREQELNARIEDYRTKLGLDQYQADEMRVILSREQDRRSELMETARESGDWMNLREEMRTVRDETRDGLAQVLTQEQLDQYEELGRGRFGPGGFGGRGGPRGGDEPPGDRRP